MSVVVAATSDRPFATDVKGRKGIELARIGQTNDHAKLLLYGRIRARRLHAAKFERLSPVLAEIREDC